MLAPKRPLLLAADAWSPIAPADGGGLSGNTEPVGTELRQQNWKPQDGNAANTR